MIKFLNSRTSIYKRIASKTGKKGWLPANFSLNYGNADEAKTLPGETDGRALHDPSPSELSDEAFGSLLRLLRDACYVSNEKTEKELSGFLEGVYVYRLLDRLCEEIYIEKNGIDLLNLLDTAFKWATESRDVNMVKLGISLMGMLNLDEREYCRSVIITLGKYEEFTLYSLFAVSGRADANAITFDYAKNLKGWGRILAIEWLEPETDEINEWILENSRSS